MSEPNSESAERHEMVELEGRQHPLSEQEKEQEDPSNMDDSVVDSSINAAEKSEDAGTADDEGSDSDESLPPGLLERPVEILENKRARKKITRFSYDDEKQSPITEKKNVEIPKGIGIPLKNHPRVEYQLQRNTVDDLKIIHKFLYGIPGTNHLVKRNIRDFCGFVIDKDSPQYEKKEDILGRFTVDNLKWALMVLDVPAKGKKEELMDALMEWSMCPKPQDKPVPGKRTDKPKKKSKSKAKKRSANKMENGDTTSDAGTLAKKPKKTKKKASEKTAKIKLKSTKKLKTDEPSSSDDEPLQKRKAAPSNNEIKKFVETMLKGANLEVLTMKVVFQKVYEKYPDFDLTDRKTFIKETVKKIIS